MLNLYSVVCNFVYTNQLFTVYSNMFGLYSVVCVQNNELLRVICSIFSFMNYSAYSVACLIYTPSSDISYKQFGVIGYLSYL